MSVLFIPFGIAGIFYFSLKNKINQKKILFCLEFSSFSVKIPVGTFRFYSIPVKWCFFLKKIISNFTVLIISFNLTIRLDRDFIRGFLTY